MRQASAAAMSSPARTYIYGGNITATSKKLGAGIGGGRAENMSGTITINRSG